MMIAESLQQSWDIKAKLRLLDVFEGVTHRDLIKVEKIFFFHLQNKN